MSKAKSDFYKVAEVELMYRRKRKSFEELQISSSLDAYKILLNAWDKKKIDLQEQFKILLLDQKNSVLGISNVATGDVSACPVDAKIVFTTALLAHASAIILAHNHPSGSTTFSTSDRNLTEKFVEAGKNLDIRVLDHLVVTSEGYKSFSDEGLLPAVHMHL